MREILFRGKRKDNGEWAEGYFVEFVARYDITNKKGSYIQTIKENGALNLIHGVDPSTVGQYTGLQDKNGNPICEGHIVKCRHIFIDAFEKIKEKNPRKSYGKEIEEMAYGDFQCRYWRNYAVSFHDGGIRMQNGSDTCYLKQSYIRNHEVEIIGNIHDNPELLKGGQGNGN